jgi:hypothetical protein
MVTSNLLCQRQDSVRNPSFFSGVITATNNGISLIPSFTLGRPAMLFDLSMGKGRWSFDPMLRFGMDGKPWAFIFWGRYKLINNSKFKMNIGAHPSIVFREIKETTISGEMKNYLNSQRYFAWEATPTFFINKNVNFGISYLGATGLTNDLVQSTTFLSLRSTISNIPVNTSYSLSFSPQVFYLRMDKLDGTYASAIIGINKSNLPFSLSTVLSQKLKSGIAGKEFLWNIQLQYNINNQYLKIPM